MNSKVTNKLFTRRNKAERVFRKKVDLLIHIAICDDEKYFREQIEHLITIYLNKHQLEDKVAIETFSSGKDLCDKKSDVKKYDIVFLDISMDDLNGIETAYKIREYRKDAYIIFVTSFFNYALEGYKVDAFRYIMKDTLEISITECLDGIFEKMRSQIDTINFKFLEGTKSVFIDKIVFIESQKHKLTFHIITPKAVQYSMYSKLDDIEAQLKEYKFLRIHKSYLVNMKYIMKVSNYKVTLTSGDEFVVPKPRYQMVKEEYALHKGEL